MNTDTTDIKAMLMEGVDLLVNTIKVTLGTKGRLVLYNNFRDFDDTKGMATITKDGFTVAKAINPSNPIHNLAVQIVREASRKTVEASGDGTTSTSIFAQALIKEGYRLTQKEKVMTAWEFKKYLDLAISDLKDYITSCSISVDEDIAKLKNIATISSNDEEIGQLIYDIVKEIGPYGDIEPRQTFASETSVELVKGMKVNKGYFAPFFCNDLEKMTFEAQNCNILLFDDTVRDYTDIANYIRASVNDTGDVLPILIFVQDVASTVLTRIEGMMKYNPGRPIMIVNHDGFGDRMIAIMNDISMCTGAIIVDNSVDSTEASKYLGRCEKVVVNQKTTCMYGGNADEDALREECRVIINMLNDPTIDLGEKKFLRKRLANLSGGIAVINVGGVTKVEMEEKFFRIEDAVLAVRSAIRDGVVPGGGYTYMSAVTALNKNKKRSSHPAYQAALNALLSIPKQLLINSELYTDEFFQLMQDNASKNKALDLITNKFYSIKDYNVYDATSVLIDTVTNASAVAKSILSIDKVVHSGNVY